jgi:hypothetical protein
MFPVSEASFTAHHASAAERKMILHWSATVSTKKRPYLRWMHHYRGIVFVADPNYFDSKTGWYTTWAALNTNIIVDQFRCEIHAGPPR